MERMEKLDASRGIAVALMLIYHLLCDLEFLGIADVDLADWRMVLLQRVVGGMFVLIAGISMGASEEGNELGAKRHIYRALRLGAVALLITTATWIYPHDGFIRFGIIHMLAISTLIATPLQRDKRACIALGMLLIMAGWITGGTMSDSPYLFWLGIIHPGYDTLDHYPILPWTGLFLLGLGASGWARRIIRRIPLMPPVASNLALLGRNSLAIYLLHQPVLIGALMAYGTFVAV